MNRTAGPLPRTYPLHPSGVQRISPLPRKYRYDRAGPWLQHEVEVTGFNVLLEHFLAASLVVSNTAIPMLEVTADMGVQIARQLVPYDTGATHDSIVALPAKPGMLTRSGEHQWAVEVVAQTFYAPFLEYGTIHMHPRPFMLPAHDLMAKVLVASVKAILKAVFKAEAGSGLGSDGVSGPVVNSPQVKGVFASLRGYLYSTAKLLGDISVIGGRGVLGPLRGQMYYAAKLLGDVNSVVGGSVTTRITNRLSGRFKGRIIGFGSNEISFAKTYSAFPGGALGHRAYQRIAGAQIKTFGRNLKSVSW